VQYLSASAVVIHYEEALYQVYGPLPFAGVAKPLVSQQSPLSQPSANVNPKYGVDGQQYATQPGYHKAAIH